MRLISAWLGVAALLSIAATAAAQGIGGYPAGLQIGGGVVFPVGASASASGLGWDVSVAGDFEFRPGLAVRLDYFYERFAADEAGVRSAASSLPPRSATMGAKTQGHFGTLDIAWKRPWRDGRGSIYAFGGPVVALRRVTITSVRADGGSAFNEALVDFCEPQWLQCARGPIPYHLVLGIRRSVDLGVNAGFGATLDVGLNARLFAEARYVLIDGPSYSDSSGRSRSSNATYIPVMAGIRFQIE